MGALDRTRRFYCVRVERAVRNVSQGVDVRFICPLLIGRSKPGRYVDGVRSVSCARLSGSKTIQTENGPEEFSD